MRREQGYNISKIQSGTSYFDMLFGRHTENWWPQSDHYFSKLDLFLIKYGIKKIISIGYFVEKNILYHLRHSAPQTVKKWRSKSQNTARIEKVDFSSKTQQFMEIGPVPISCR